VRVRFFRLGASSLDVEVFAYLFAQDWSHFLEIQERLLFGVTEIVDRAGTGIAFPSQTMYVADPLRALSSADALPAAASATDGPRAGTVTTESAPRPGTAAPSER
jgi:MscS family membrane protein